MVGDYTNAHTKTEFMCEAGHRWLAKPNNILSGYGCPTCKALKSTLSIDDVNERLLSDARGIKVIDYKMSTKSKSEFECVSGHRWVSTLNGIISGKNGCPHCSETKLTIDKVNDRLANDGRTITQIGEYVSARTKSEFRCQDGHVWVTTPDSVLRGHGCPVCANYGFNPQEPGWEYVLDFGHFLKFGITNNLVGRLNDHKKNGIYKVVHTRHHEVGQFALDWENHIKRTHGGRFVTKDQCPDGWTETLCVSKLAMILESRVKDGG
jgi:Zn finger protein HypA/HybF involved in hydrogenase expression